MKLLIFLKNQRLHYEENSVLESYLFLVATQNYREDSREISQQINRIMSELINVKANVDDHKFHIKNGQMYSKELKQFIDDKASQEEVEILSEKFGEYCAFEDLLVLQDKVIPVVKDFKTNIEQVNIDMDQNKQIIRRFDEVLSSKASKIALDQQDKKLKSYFSMKQFREFDSNLEKYKKESSKTLSEFNKKLGKI